MLVQMKLKRVELDTEGRSPREGASSIVLYILHENHDIAIAMSSSRADPVLGLNILQGHLNV